MVLEKILQSQGFGTRRQCRNLILDGAVLIDGRVYNDPSERLPVKNLKLFINGESWQYQEHLYLIMNKPEGYECSHKPQHHASIFGLIPWQFINRNLQCVGRLDQDTTGLLLLSDDGQFIHRYTSPKKHVPKIYQLSTADRITDTQITNLINGVQLHHEKTISQALACKRLGTHRMEITIDEGKYHQIKRMIAAVGNKVVMLHRQAIGHLELPANLKQGTWRHLTNIEIQRLASDSSLKRDI